MDGPRRRQEESIGPDRGAVLPKPVAESVELYREPGDTVSSMEDGSGRDPATYERDATSKVADWIEECRPAMVAAALCQGVDGDAAEDMVQRASLAAVSVARKDPERVLAIASPCGWLVRFVKNEARNMVRKRRRRARILRDNALEFVERMSPRDRCGCGVEVRITQVVRAACRVLSDRQFHVICRVLLHGMTDGQVAADLRIARVTARRHRVLATKVLEEAFRPAGKRNGEEAR